MINTLFPDHFPALALAHFMALLSPGPDFFLITAYAMRFRLRGSVGLCVGIASGNALYILLAALGLGSALLNPKNMLFYLSLMTTLLGPQATWLQQAMSGTWMVLMVQVWDVSIAMLIARPSLQRRLAGSIHWLERGAGVVLFGLGAYLLLR
ncbi:LysE family translocator [Lonsdalea quercina]|uniref:LysE family translocator n=1 Tax=Lonsdalea quercina TaxID=71657 RepID=UPI003974E473